MTEKAENILLKNTHDIIDYRGDCWRAYQDVGLCLMMLPAGKAFEFIVEREKYNNIKKIIDRNGGRIVSESKMDDGVQLKVLKDSKPN